MFVVLARVRSIGFLRLSHAKGRWNLAAIFFAPAGAQKGEEVRRILLDNRVSCVKMEIVCTKGCSFFLIVMEDKGVAFRQGENDAFFYVLIPVQS
jgi:hypothetical protein